MAISFDFKTSFKHLTGNDPFPWQRGLYERFIAGDFPPSCSLPTGMGKTSVIAIWLLALAKQAAHVEAAKRVPRRLAYVVNRRTIVDQATREAEKLREYIQKPELKEVRDRLEVLCGGATTGEPLAISTLRGQFADNGEWSTDPARPAIIVGTVDMIGSRLLFSGYGRGFKHRPLHAGFLGQDTLLVHDEAHLEPAFQDLLDTIKGEQVRCKDFRPLHVLPLTATPRGDEIEEPFELTEKDYRNEIVKRRLEARKAISFHRIDDEKKIAESVAALAMNRAKESPASAILVFVRKVEDVKKVVEALKKAKIESNKIAQLTGTLRGKERDELVEKPAFQHFLPKSNRTTQDELPIETVFLICTSAGEVGVDISADHLICDLTPYDSMAQRFGRVNRYGDGDAIIDIVHPEKFETDGKNKEYELRRKNTLQLLRELDADGSPKKLREQLKVLGEELGRMKPPRKIEEFVFSPKPRTLPATDILFDAWALTSICKHLTGLEAMPGRPPVADWLHGVPEDWQPTETQVAWRSEVQWIRDDLLKEYEPEDLLEVYPLKPHELLKEPSYRAINELKLIASRFESVDVPVWIADDRGVEVVTLQKLVDRGEDAIGNRTVILPPFAGGLSGGMLDGKSDTADDLADLWFDEKDQQRRQRVWDPDPDNPPAGMRPARAAIYIAPGEDDSGTSDEANAENAIEEQQADEQDGHSIPPAPGKIWQWYARPLSADDDGSRNSEKRVELRVHTGDVVRNVKRMVQALGIAQTTEGKTLLLAAQWHDLGKDRQVWQRSIRNDDYPTPTLAKSGNRRPPFDLGRFRHEFGSLLDVLSPNLESEWAALSEAEKELVLHFIATHHGRARPHFPSEEARDPERSSLVAADIAREIPRRFARLQQKYGRWGLAYLESILRAADGAASAKPSKTLGEESTTEAEV